MEINEEIKELQNQIGFIKEKIMKTANEVKEALRQDLPLFVNREIKKHFVNNPEFARSLSDEEIKKIKQRINSITPAVVEKILVDIDSENLWMKGLEITSEGKSFMENHELWKVTSPIEELTKKIMKEFNFLGCTEEITYKAPSWFIGKYYLPSLAEKYWKHINEIKEIQRKIEELKKEKERNELSKRWNGI